MFSFSKYDVMSQVFATLCQIHINTFQLGLNYRVVVHTEQIHKEYIPYFQFTNNFFTHTGSNYANLENLDDHRSVIARRSNDILSQQWLHSAKIDCTYVVFEMMKRVLTFLVMNTPLVSVSHLRHQ